MAFNKVSPEEFIQQTFPPRIAVISTSVVEATCKKNNLSFVEMIRPFCKGTFEGSIKDPSGTSVPIRHLHVCFSDIDSRPPPLPIARSYLIKVINTFVQDKTVEVIAGNDRIDVPVSVPWFEAWRSTFLQVQYPSDHEFTQHYVGCLLVISSEDHSPIDRLKKMMIQVHEMVQHGSSKLPKWFTPASFVLTSLLLVHDASTGDPNMCLPLFENMKSCFGTSNSFFLTINSRRKHDVRSSSHIPDPWAQFLLTSINYKEEPKEAETTSGVDFVHEREDKRSSSTPFLVHPLSPVTEGGSSLLKTMNTTKWGKPACKHHGRCLTTEDINRIKQFVNDFCVKALLPHFEQSMHLLNDQISNKKGMSRSLFSVTKRWFGANKPNSSGNNLSPTAIAYSNDSHELQLRRLGDLAFMIGHYLLAYSAYHGAKRDFSADGAWLHYSGALEMAALAAFMSGNEALARKVIDYADESITTYLYPCRVNQFATRATLLSVECLKGRGLYGEAAKQLIRMSAEDTELRSAVLLEQAAYMFLSSKMHRKYAFHLILAGNRYNKAGHRNHAICCYYQAYQIYGGKCWSIAEDHVLYTIGKQSAHMKLITNSVEALSHLVKRSSRQTAQQQALYLQEYIDTIRQLILAGSEASLSLPIINSRTTQTILNFSRDAFEDSVTEDHQYLEDPKWWKMEEKLVSFIEGGLSSMTFKPSIGILSYKSDNSNPSTVVVGEQIGININLQNPLHVPIKISGLKLLCRMRPEKLDDEVFEVFTKTTCAYSETLYDFTIGPDSNKYVLGVLNPSRVGDLQVIGIKYSLTDLPGTHFVTGMQPLKLTSPGQPLDKRLHFKVIDNAPFLQVSYIDLHCYIFSGEVLPVTICFENFGRIGISRIFIACGPSFYFWVEGNPPKSEEIFQVPTDGILGPGEKFQVQVFIYPRYKNKIEHLDLLFYYESDITTTPRYRLVRHSWDTMVHNLFEISSLTVKSHSLKFEEAALNIKMRMTLLKTTIDAPKLLSEVGISSLSLLGPSWKLSSVFTPLDFSVAEEGSVNILIQAVRKKPFKNSLTSAHYLYEEDTVPFKFCLPNIGNKIEPDQCNYVLGYLNWTLLAVDIYGTRSMLGQECVYINTNLRDQVPFDPFSTPGTLRIFGKQQTKRSSRFNKLIYYQLHHPPIINHNFSKNRLCTLPITLWLHNSSQDALSTKVDLVPLLKDPSEAEKPHIVFDWVGKTEFWLEVNGLGKTSVKLQAIFSMPGIYDLSSRINILAKVKEEMIIQSCQKKASVIIS